MLIRTVIFRLHLKRKPCCQMLVPAFLDERRQRLRHILHCCTTKNPNYNIHCPSPHSSTQLRPVTPVASPSLFTSRLCFCASGPVGSVIRWQWRERPRRKLDTACLRDARQRFCRRTFFFFSIFFIGCRAASAETDGKRSNSVSQFAVSSLQKCPALYLGVALPVHYV